MSTPETSTPATETPGVQVEEQTKRGTTTVRDPSRIQTAIARRMSEVRATVPLWTATVDADVDALLDRLADTAGEPALVDAAIVATGLALRDHERVNGAWRDGKLETWTRANVSLAIDTDGSGIVLPVFPSADERSVTDTAERRRELERRAAANDLRAPDSAGPTFALSDAGPDGADRFDVVQPPGLGGAVAIGRPRPRAWVVDGRVVPRRVASITLTADHRAIYPSHGGAFLRRVATLLEDPAAILG